MKKQVLTLALTGFIGFGAALASAQSEQSPAPPDAQGQPAPNGEAHPGGRRPDPSRQLKRMTKELKLTSDQQSKILPILTDRASQMDSIRSDSSLSQDDRHSKMKSLRDDSEGKIRAVLTDEQKQKYDQMQQQMRERMQEHRPQ